MKTTPWCHSLFKIFGNCMAFTPEVFNVWMSIWEQIQIRIDENQTPIPYHGVTHWSLADRVSLWISKTGRPYVHEINKRQRKCHVNCVGEMPERKVTTKCVSVIYKYIYNDKVSNPGHRAGSSADETPDVSPFLLLTRGEEADGPGVKSRKNCKCTRLANFESDYDLRTKKNEHD